jgi:hypothetical protein
VQNKAQNLVQIILSPFEATVSEYSALLGKVARFLPYREMLES